MKPSLHLLEPAARLCPGLARLLVLAALAGRAVRLKIELTDGRLFAFQFR